ncbi:MAG: hypothetical protein OXG90_13150 [Gammaproteobacteria bacterium]|nr:hypothetical protein [Gammaproteobacteria bacterium]
MSEITGTNSPETLHGTGADDEIRAGAGDDTVYGGEGDDLLFGENGNDELIGGAGEDELFGGDGNDILKGGAGFDILRGGAGDDTFLVTDLYDHIHDASGNDKAIVSVSFAKIPAEIEQVEYVDGAVPLPYWISALIASDSSGSYYSWALGEEKTFQYVFPSRLPAYAASRHAEGYRQLTPIQQTNAVIGLEYLESIIDVKMIRTEYPDQLNTISIALQDLGEEVGGTAYHPDSRSRGSDIYINAADSSRTLGAGTFGAYLFMHELGHALGLKHPFDEPDVDDKVADPPYLQGAEDHSRWTIMSYKESPAEYRLYFSELDIAALQYLYGPSRKSRTGDDVYRVRLDAPNFIWDGGGVDTIDASRSPLPVTIFLEPGYWGHIGREGPAETITAPRQITVNFGSEIENLIGSRHSDALTGNGLDNFIRGGAGDDKLEGGPGNDRIQGGMGSDELIGGDGLDFAVYVGARDGYNVATDPDGIVIRAKNDTGGTATIETGTDRLFDIERISFADINLAFDFKGNAGRAVKTIGAFLGADGIRDSGLVGYVLNLLDNGMPYVELLQTAIETVFGQDPDGPAMVRYFFEALTGQQAPEDIVNDLGGMVGSGGVSALELAMLAADHELNLANIDFVGLAASGVEYLVV